MKLHYYESILNFYCDSLTEEELLEKIREWTLRFSGIERSARRRAEI